jgi:hypothetical protein
MAEVIIGGGWFGQRAQVMHALSVVGADRAPDGKGFRTSGRIYAGLDPEEWVLGADAKYYVDGTECSLPHLMNSTSYGVRNITVI